VYIDHLERYFFRAASKKRIEIVHFEVHYCRSIHAQNVPYHTERTVFHLGAGCRANGCFPEDHPYQL